MNHHRRAGLRNVIRLPAVQQEAHAARRSVLAVGVDHYAAPHFERLRAATRDARTAARLLQSDFGYSQAVVLTNRQAGLGVVLTAARRLLAKSGQHDQVLIYFAGHATLHDQRLHLVLYDSEWKRPETLLPIAELISLCNAGSTGEILIVLDTCYSGASLILPELEDRLPQEERKWRQVREIIASASPHQAALDQGAGQHSPFSQCFLDILGGLEPVETAVDGSFEARVLLGSLRRLLPRRIREVEASWGHVQAPLGGLLAGNSESRSFRFEPQVFRLPWRDLSDLREGDPQVQQAALKRIGLEWRPGARQLLARHVLLLLKRAEEASTRAQAAATAGRLRLRGSAIRHGLRQALSDVSAVRQEALRSMGRLGSREDRSVLLDLVSSEPPEMALAAACALLRSGSSIEEQIELLRRAQGRGLLAFVIGRDLPSSLTGEPSTEGVAGFLRWYARPFSRARSLSGLTDALRGRQGFSQVIRDAFASLAATSEPGPFYFALADVKPSTVIDCTYGDLLARALGAQSCQTVVAEGDARAGVSDSRCAVLKPLGHFASTEAELVTGSSQLSSYASTHPALCERIKGELQGHLALLFGFDGRRKDSRLLFEYILDNAEPTACILVDLKPVRIHSGRTRTYPIRCHPVSLLKVIRPVKEEPYEQECPHTQDFCAAIRR